MGENHAWPTIQHSVDMKNTAERAGGEADLCRVRLVCRALWMTWISSLLVPKNWSNTKWISSQSFGAQSRGLASYSRVLFSPGKDAQTDALFSFYMVSVCWKGAYYYTHPEIACIFTLHICQIPYSKPLNVHILTVVHQSGFCTSGPSCFSQDTHLAGGFSCLCPG